MKDFPWVKESKKEFIRDKRKNFKRLKKELKSFSFGSVLMSKDIYFAYCQVRESLARLEEKLKIYWKNY